MDSKLLDNNCDQFLIEKWNSESFNANIRDENKEIIGKITSSTESKRQITLLDEDHSIILRATGKGWPRPANWEIKNSKEETIGKIKKKRFSFSKDMEIENESGVVVLFSKGLEANNRIEFRDKDGNIVAEFLNKKKFKIKNNQFDRKVLYGLFLCVYYHLSEFTIRMEKFSQEGGDAGL